MTLMQIGGWVYAVLLGSLVWLALAGRQRQAGEWAAGLGYGVLFGLAACGLLVGLHSRAVGVDLPAALLPWLIAALGGIAGLAWWRQRRPAIVAPMAQSKKIPGWTWVLLALLAVRFLFILDEAWLRPVFAWDAWIAWSLKAKSWFYTGQSAGYVGPNDWWYSTDASLRSSLAWHYPELLSRIELWLAGTAGAWNEAAVGLAWPILWLALLLGCYGQWLALGIDRPLAIVAVYGLGSIPLLSVHAALAGYADLWVATALVFALLAWLRWLEARDTGQLALALLALLLLPMLKFEGMVWATALGGLILIAEVPRRWRWAGIVAAAAIAMALLAVSYWLDLAWFATVRKILSGEAGGRAAVALDTVVRSFGSGLFVQYNWHLLWAVLPAVLVWRRKILVARRAVGLLALFLAGAMLAVFGLFVLTPAAKWAESDTAANRLVLQLVPAAVTLLALLLRDWRGHPEPVGTDHRSERLSLPE